MAELADAPDLGSGGLPVQVQVLLPAPGRAWTQAASRARFFSFAFSLAFVAGLFCSVIPCRVLLKDLKSSFDNTPHFLFPNLYSGLCGGVA